MATENPDRAIRGEVIVPAGVDAVWEAWTTPEGITSFFGPACNIDLRVDGSYEILFDPEAEPGRRGGEGVRILALQPRNMLAFTWNAPPSMPEVRKQRTHVVVRFTPVGEASTKVTLFHDGWGVGPEWDEAFDYFTKAWIDLVLPRLKHRFTVGPVDWNSPPRFP